MRRGNFVGASTSGVPIGHISLAKNTCHSFKLCMRIFKTKCYQEPLVSFIEVGHFRFFDASIIMRDGGGEYGLEGSI